MFEVGPDGSNVVSEVGSQDRKSISRLLAVACLAACQVDEVLKHACRLLLSARVKYGCTPGSVRHGTLARKK
jgi:hypothetical protein